MADIYGSHFEFAGISSREFGLIIVNINTDRFVKVGGSIKSSTVFSHRANQKYLIGTDYTDSNMSIDIEIITEDERPIERDERRAIEKWLFHHNEYCKMYLDIADDFNADTYEYVDGDIKRNYFNCRLLNPEKIESGSGTIGYKVTMETDSNLMWQDSIEKSFETNINTSDASAIIDVIVDTDSLNYTYPTVTINIGDVGGDIIISNNSDDSSRLTKFVDMSPNTTIIMKGESNYISGQYYTKFSTKNFIRLLDGVNKLAVMGNVKSIKIAFSNRRGL